MIRVHDSRHDRAALGRAVLHRGPLAFLGPADRVALVGEQCSLAHYLPPAVMSLRTVARLLLLALWLAAGCLDDPTSCAELGCPVAPSGDPDAWTPCDEAICYCPTTTGPEVCTHEAR